ncbi:MAG: ABC transporter ATP-binding protein [bacterium]
MEKHTTILAATDLHRIFETADSTVAVLTGLSLSVQTGQMVAVTGVSGVGKSTLLHVLGGLDRPSQGQVTIGNEILQNMSEKRLAQYRNEKVGFVFQFHYLLQDFTALENVMMPSLVSGKSRRDARMNAEQLLDLVGLKDRTSHRPMQLSGGEQQRVAVARALANNPEIVLADEPSGNLDTNTGRNLHDLLFHLNQERNVTFLIATHNQELAQRCDRNLQIVDGKVRELSQVNR